MGANQSLALELSTMAAADRPGPNGRPDRNSRLVDSPPPADAGHGPEHAESLAAATHDVSREIAQQLTAALDRLAPLELALTRGSIAGTSLDRAMESIRGAAELAGRLAELAGPRVQPAELFLVADEDGEPARSPKVLLVDDDEFVRASVAAVLLARRVQVVAAGDGQQALELFADGASGFDAVILDMNMPALGGAAVLAELRAIRSDVKVVLSSGGPLELRDEQLDGCNCLAFAHKSLGPHELLSQLQRLLGRSF
jgi:CheY-like chemotaxis protein